MADTLAPRAIIGVMTPAMNTVVQPELELLRPEGVTNQMQRFRLGGDAVSDDLIEEAQKLMDCNPVAIAVGLTTDAGPGGVQKLAARCAELEAAVAYARRAVELSAGDAGTQDTLAFALAASGRPKEALEKLMAALKAKEKADSGDES